MQAKTAPKASPLHDSAGSEQSLDDDSPGPEPSFRKGEQPSDNDSSSSSSQEGGSVGLKDNISISAKGTNGFSKSTGQDSAHLVGFPQRISSMKARSEAIHYQLGCGGIAGSFLPDDAEVNIRFFSS